MLSILGNLLFLESKLIYPNPLKKKKAECRRFLGLKAPLHKTYKSNPHFFSRSWKLCVLALSKYQTCAGSFSNHHAEMCSMLWDSHGGTVLQSLILIHILILWSLVFFFANFLQYFVIFMFSYIFLKLTYLQWFCLKRPWCQMTFYISTFGLF